MQFIINSTRNRTYLLNLLEAFYCITTKHFSLNIILFINLLKISFMKNISDSAKFQEKRIISFSWNQFISTFIMFLIIIFLSFKLNAQDSKELGKTINLLLSSSSASDNDLANHLKSLVYNLQTTVFLENGNIKTLDDKSPVCADVDAQSISLLSETNSLFENVELITIRLKSSQDISNIIKLASLKSFHKLRFIVFLCSFNCDSALINKLYLPDSNSVIPVYYLISIPE